MLNPSSDLRPEEKEEEKNVFAKKTGCQKAFAHQLWLSYTQ